MNKMLKTVEDFKSFFKGYEVIEEFDEDGKVVSLVIRGNSIVAAVCFGRHWYRTLTNRIGLESDETFNKWSQVPVSLKLPVDSKRLSKLIEFVKSPKGIEMSDGFKTIDWDGGL